MRAYLETVPESTKKISSQTLRKEMKADTLAPRTWGAVVETVSKRSAGSLKNSTEHCRPFSWTIQGKSLVRITGELYGFIEEVA